MAKSIELKIIEKVEVNVKINKKKICASRLSKGTPGIFQEQPMSLGEIFRG